MNNNDSLPISAHGTADDRPLDMIDTPTLRAYARQLRRRYSNAMLEGRNAYATALDESHRAIMTELRNRI